MVYDEAAYLLNGQTAEAKVINTFISTGRTPRLNVEYGFTESPSLKASERSLYRKAYLVTDPDDKEVPREGTFMVRYTSGEDGRSRRLGHPHWGWICLFFGSILSVFVAGYLVSREAYATDPKKRKK